MSDITTAPDHPASVWTGEKWERVVAAIMEDGGLRLMPESICAKCVMLFTENEWAAFPQPPNDFYHWNFTEEKWEDRRDPALLRKEAGLRVRNVFEAERWRAWGAYIPEYEAATWPGQVKEADSWLVDQSADTPGIDAYLDALGDEAPEKAGLCLDIIQNNKDYRALVMAVNGRQRLWLNRLARCEGNAAVDALMAELDSFDESRRKAA